MSEPTVFLVTSGEYSDFRIEATYSNEEAAKYHAQRLNALHSYAGAAVQAWPLHSERPTFRPLHVASIRDGKMESVRSYDMVPQWGDVADVEESGYPGMRRAASTDLKRALKAARDRAAKDAAEAAGL